MNHESLLGASGKTPLLNAQAPSEPAPVFELDPTWPKPLPDNWMFGAIWGATVDSRDHEEHEAFQVFTS